MPTKEMLINYVPGEECRIAIVEDGKLEELYQERHSAGSHVGNIYKGRVTNVEPAIQAAFIDFGLERHGFLHISDLHPKYFPGDHKEETETVGMRTPRRDRPPIQRCLKRGQEVLVQVLKEGIGTKGPTVTSYLSIPGRYLVMMPDMERLGVSRKIEDDEIRRKMRKMLDELDPPKEFGFIIRTAGLDRNKTELKRDLAYLLRLWKSLDQRRKEVRVGELYTESDLVVRTIRDVYASDIQRIIVDDPVAARRAAEFLSISNPRSGSSVLVYRDPVPIFHRFGIEEQIDIISSKTVPLPSGGSLVIESTEALVAIDVNSGKMRDNRDAEETAYRTNLEATDEICRQLRLRDLGGVVVNDLIDMRDAKRRRAIEARFKANLKKDRAKTRTSTISAFGILEMTRQRMRPSLTKSLFCECPHCKGQGMVKSAESVVLDVMRRLSFAMHHAGVDRIELTVSPDVAFQLLNRKRSQLVHLEQAHGKPVLVRVNGGGPMDYIEIVGYDQRGGVVDPPPIDPHAQPTLEPIEDLPIEQLEEDRTGGEDSVDPDALDAIDQGDAQPADGPSMGFVSTPDTAQATTPASADDGGAVEAAADGHSDEPSPDAEAQPISGPDSPPAEGGATAGGGRRRRRRRRRGGRGRGGDGQPALPSQPTHPSPALVNDPPPTRERMAAPARTEHPHAPASDSPAPPVAPPPGPVARPEGEQPPPSDGSGRRRRRRRRGGRGRGGQGGAAAGPTANGSGDSGPASMPESGPPTGSDAMPPRPDGPVVSRGYRNNVVPGDRSE